MKKVFNVDTIVKSLITGKKMRNQKETIRVGDLIYSICLSNDLIEKEKSIQNYNAKIVLFQIAAKIRNTLDTKKNELEVSDDEITLIKVCCGVLLSVEACAFIQDFFSNPIEKPSTDE